MIDIIASKIHKINHKFIRFILVGVINTLFSLSVYWILIYLGAHYSLAMLIANILGILFNYKTTGKFVFENNENRMIIRFLILNAIMYLIGVLGLKALISAGVNSYAAAIVLAPPMAICSFFLSKYYVFNKSKRVAS